MKDTESSWVYRRNAEIRNLHHWPEGMHRTMLTVEYMGADYQGFQRQSSARRTVQGELEKGLSAVADEPITLACAGRTDAGVHATQQVVHFDTLAKRPNKAWREGVNTKLPDTIRVVSSQEVSPLFHARFSARARTYRYVIYRAPTRSALFNPQMTWTKFASDVALMQAGANYLIGEHDFTTFRARFCQAKTPVREIKKLHFYECGDLIVMEITATAFLYNMVRRIVGALAEVGRGAKPPEWIGEILNAKDRAVAAVTAPPNGLYFVGVDYPAFPEINIAPKGPCFVDSFVEGFVDTSV